MMDNSTGIEALSHREQQVAVGYACGMEPQEIAARLGISVKTVSTHREHALSKLGLNGNAALARWAVFRGYVEHTGVPTPGYELPPVPAKDKAA